MAASIVWFQRDLRLTDNQALAAAFKHRETIYPIYLWSEKKTAAGQVGKVSKVWLQDSLRRLDESLRGLGSQLWILPCDSTHESLHTVLLNFAQKVSASHVFWNLPAEPQERAQTESVRLHLSEHDIVCRSFDSSMLFSPGTVLTKAGAPFLMFTPFYKASCSQFSTLQKPIRVIEALGGDTKKNNSLAAKNSELQSKVLGLASLFPDSNLKWQPGEKGAIAVLQAWAKSAVNRYPTARDIPSLDGTSRVSPHLNYGELSPRQIFFSVKNQSVGKDVYIRQLLWRDFAVQLLISRPSLQYEAMDSRFEKFPYRNSEVELQAWQFGMTGYPLVDAGMRQLLQCGWMHNRVRMLVASFLVKHLLLDWRRGAEWFWERLLDANLANNTLGWQWCAGCGPDAAPYFRIFNPILQSKKFDPQGLYIQRYVPELKALEAKYIHEPWLAPDSVLQKAGVILGKTYPKPIVDHQAARMRALAAYQQMRNE